MSCFKVLDVLVWRLKAAPVALASFIEAKGQETAIFFSKNFFSAVKFSKFWTLDLELDSDPNLDLDPQLEKMPDPAPQ